MDKKLNVTIRHEVKTVDGEPFFDLEMNYYNMGRDKLVVVEGEMVNMLVKLNEIGKAAVAANTP